MIYAMSDLHGEYELFKKMLDKIKFKDSDTLFLLGDIVDYGEGSIPLLCDISMRSNVFAIFGEHDVKAYKMLKNFYKLTKSGNAPDADFISKMTAWTANGGKVTLDGFLALDDDMKTGLLDYFSEFTVYEKVDINGKKFVLVHAGIAGFEKDKPLSEYSYRAFLSVPLDFSRTYYDGEANGSEKRTIIVGHTPTSELPGGERGKIYRANGNIALNCDAGKSGGKLGCLCLDNDGEFYV